MSLLTILATAGLLLAQRPGNVTLISISPPATMVDLDMGKLKGTPARLAWSPDGAELYLQTVEGHTIQTLKRRHYLLKAGASQPQPLEAEPPWAAEYWVWKSAKTAPGHPEVSIELDSRNQAERVQNQSLRERAAGSASGGRTGAGLSIEYQSINTSTMRMLLKGEIIGEFVNEQPVPGLTFGWSPEKSGLIAYVAPGASKVTVMDFEGRKQQIEDSKDAVLPAWSQDGARIAYLQRRGKKEYAVAVANVTLR